MTESMPCLVGNVKANGTKHFASGTKLYCLPLQWHSYERIVVIGRHRGGPKLKIMVIPSECIENWRCKIVYNPAVLEKLKLAASKWNNRLWQSEDEVQNAVEAFVNQRNANDRAKI